MIQTRFSRLSAAGWTVGDATNFLELSTEDRDYVELKIALAALLENAVESRSTYPSHHGQAGGHQPIPAGEDGACRRDRVRGSSGVNPDVDWRPQGGHRSSHHFLINQFQDGREHADCRGKKS